MFRQTLLRQSRLFSTSVRVQKSAVEAAKDTITTADKAVSQKIVQGIEATESATEKVKETVAGGAKEAQRKAEDVKDDAARKAENAKNEAARKTEDAAKEARK
ncbi:hypothetical protein TI39_contig4323g00003 [Zymoseptoria brevis]|uniref:Lea domain protein n=1 Tax=Zymoseptoria brevis TaxID=1047168 RepID=A0A0F4GB01_9PEZI|nr:hypothetical protein TI39_contig4323g00003 [Zymoseptoria brevis]